MRMRTALESLGRNQIDQPGRSGQEFLRDCFGLLEEYEICYCILNPCEAFPDKLSAESEVAAHLGPSAMREPLRLLDQCQLSYYIPPLATVPEKLPANTDIAIDPSDLAKCGFVFRGLNSKGYRLVRCLSSSATGYHFVFMWVEGATLNSMTVNLVHHWRLPLPVNVGDVLARRQRSKDFWVADSETEFAHLLVRNVLQRTDSPSWQHHRLTALAGQLGRAGVEWLAGELFGKKWRGEVADACASGFLGCTGANLRKQFWKNSVVHHPLHWLRYWSSECLRRMSCYLRTTGFFIVLLGPDGVGKSSLIEQLTRAVEPAFPKQRVFHFRPMLLWSRKGTGPVTDPHGKPPRPGWQSAAKVCSLLLDYCFGYWLLVRPVLLRSGLVVFDRYFYDFRVDTKRYRYGGPRWLVRLLSHFVPTPDLILILSAPAKVIFSRKREVPLGELRLLCDAYQQITGELSNAVPINMNQNLNQATIDASRAIMEHLAQHSGSHPAVLATVGRRCGAKRTRWAV